MATHCQLRRYAGLTARQVEYLVALVAHEHVFGVPAREFHVRKFLTGMWAKDLLLPHGRSARIHGRGYNGASYRLLKLGYVTEHRTVDAGNARAVALPTTAKGQAKLDELRFGWRAEGSKVA